MNKKEYFLKIVIETKQRVPQRPLGLVSNFVVEKLPLLVSSVDEGKHQSDALLIAIETILSSLEADTVGSLLSRASFQQESFAGRYPFDQQLDQAAFDLKILETVLVTYGLPVPDKLVSLVNQFSEATFQLPVITYEDLIYINPGSDPRTFTRGEVGDSEYNFYLSHLRIEQTLEAVIRQVEYAAFQLEDNHNTNQALTELDRAIQIFGTALAELKTIGMDMPRNNFAVFRKFFNTHPTRGLKGPSGAFTAAVPVLDMLLGGENLDASYFDYLRDNEMYFPRSGRQKMADAYKKIENGKTLTALAASIENPQELVDRLQTISAQLRQFRGQHYKGVKHQIPGAVSGTVAGTGGEADPGKFLRQRMKMRHLKDTGNK